MITSFKTEGLGIGFDFDITLEADKPVYCFIGKNGIGKTQLLENMAKSLFFRHTMFIVLDKKWQHDWKYVGFAQKMALFTTDLLKKAGKSIMDKQEFPPNAIINGTKITGHQWIHNLVIDIYKANSVVCDKPVIFIGAKNRGFTKNIDSNNIKILSDSVNRFIESFERTLCYLNGEGLEHQEIADWFTSRLIINPNFVTKNQNRQHEAIAVLELIDKLEPGLNLVGQDAQGNKTLKLSFHEGQLLINNIPLDKLSTGYVSIIKIFQEIIAGYSGWTNESQLNEVEGIVFIDELEPHLHISWQTKIIRILREFFPNTTFFISTHSPLVLAGLKSGEGYELVRDGDVVKTKAIENIENYLLNDIVTECFGVDLNRQKIDNVDKARQQKTKTLLLNLAQTLQEDE